MMVLSPRNAASRPTSGNGVQLSDALRFMEGASQRRGMEDSAAASSGLVRPLLIHEGDLHCPALLEQAVKRREPASLAWLKALGMPAKRRRTTVWPRHQQQPVHP